MTLLPARQVTRRIAIAIASMVTASLALAGCGTAASTEVVKDQTTFNYLTSRPSSDGALSALNAVADAYSQTAEGAGFKLTVESVADRPAYLQKVKVLASSNALPDMFDADPEPYFKQIVDTGVVADIGALYKEAGVTDKFFPISIDYPKWPDGTLNLITLQANAEYFFYNKDLFKKAGVTPPQTFSEMLSALDALQGSGITPIAVAGKEQWPYFRYMSMYAFRQTGNDFIDSLADGSGSMASPAGVGSAKFLQTLSPYFQSGSTNTDYTTAVDLFTSGKAAILYNGTWELPSFVDEKDNLKPNIGYFKMPTLSATDAVPATDFFANSGIGIALKKSSLNDSMRGFLNYFFENYGNTAFHDFNVIPSIRPDLDSSVSELYANIMDDIANVKDFARVWDVMLDANSVSVLGRAAGELVVGQTSPEGLADQVDEALAQQGQSSQ
ncbi:MAG: extracellular solute-binding protein [Microbacterium sp.]|uniref:ABC transporter substrate-binding protein n=1 Tax=Microbacterium sp. TaxID=51671 RepID=UPI001ACC2F1D|nr:extracellular solute-binding protein [Microbacterium sp.]MBN9176456.1 extracellular solute-binding protein [Microbacterium sp.]